MRSSSSSPAVRAPPLPSSTRGCRPATKSGRWRGRTCSRCMNGCGGGGGTHGAAVRLRETRALPSALAPEEAVGRLKAAVAALDADPPSAASGIIRLEVPIRQRGDAIEWLRGQSSLPRCFFSARAPLPGRLPLASSNGNGSSLEQWRQQPVSVAGVGSAVFFRGTKPFSPRDWRSIKRFLSRDCPLTRAYGAIRFDARSDFALEWEDYGSFYFIVPQVEFNEFEDSSVLATTIAWDDSLCWTWQKAMDELQRTLRQISPCSIKMNESSLRTTIVSLNHVPTNASWDLAVNRALEMVKGRQRDLVKVVLARCSRYITDTCIDPVELLACLKAEGQNAYQFCVQPLDAPAFIGNSSNYFTGDT